MSLDPAELIFSQPPNTTGELVFGDDDGSGGSDSAYIAWSLDVEVSFSGLTVRAGFGVSFAVPVADVLPSFEGAYVSDTARPLTAQQRSRFQDALPQYGEVAQRYQDTRPLPHYLGSRWQDADPLARESTLGWQDAIRLRDATQVRYQDGAPLRNDVEGGYQDAIRMRNAAHNRFQQGLPLRRQTEVRFQEALRQRAARAVRYQDGILLVRDFHGGFQSGHPVTYGWWSRYQEAIVPGAGPYVPVPPQPNPCYTPSPALVFVEPMADGSGELIFVCENHDGPGPEPGATVIVPVREVYVVLNTHTLRRVDGNILLPTFGMSLSLDVGSWTWSFNASLPIAAFDDVRPASDGTPVELEATINGVPYRWLVENRSRDRRFGDTRFTISGRGLLARLGDPFSPFLNFGNENARTGQQLMADALSFNGVPLDWDIDWQIEDWNQPGGLWTKQGTYIDALTEIAEAVGAYIQPTNATQGLRVLAQYPALPRDWSTLTPDLELPDGAVTVESTGWAQKPRYNRVYVSGANGGVVGRVTLAGTDGANQAPDVVSPLIGDAVAARMRGQRVLGETGHIATYGLRTAVGIRDEDDNPIGIIPPGRFIRYIENGMPKIGLSRAVQVDVDPVEAWQTIQVEVHEDVESV